MSKNFIIHLLKIILSGFLLFLLTIPCNAGKFSRQNPPGNTAQDTENIQQTDSAPDQMSDTGELQSDTGLQTDTGGLQSDTMEESSDGPLPDSIIYRKTDFTHEELVRGERLFYGLGYLKHQAVNCVSCHNTTVSDTLNWNPDAFEISLKYLNKTAEDLSEVLLRPVGQKMMEVHKDFQLSAEDIVLMKAFMDEFTKEGMKQPKPVITNLLILIIAFVLFSVAFTDLIIKKVFKRKSVRFATLLVTSVIITWILAVNAVAFGRAKDFSPDQPIKFSHAVHAGQNQIDCLYCHYTAETGKSAGIPSLSICYNCHLLVRNGTRSGAFEIAKITEALDSNKAVKWVRIYKLPDYVYFNHAQHVKAGKIDCVECHGNVENDDRLYQYTDLSMGWCIKCHETTKVDLTNGYYHKYYPEQVRLVHEGKLDSVMVADIGGKDCGKCHY